MDTKKRITLEKAWINYQYQHYKLWKEDKKGEINAITFEEMDCLEGAWACDKLMDLVSEDPELLWKIILEILSLDSSGPVLMNLAAGPLESLLARHGPQFIDRVETEAQKAAPFKKLLGGVWQNRMSDDIWKRVEIARGSERW